MKRSERREDQPLIEQPGRCEAILNSTYHWRCTNRASADFSGPNDTAICGVHLRAHRVTVPERWEHWVNDSGVVTCKPIVPFTHIGAHP